MFTIKIHHNCDFTSLPDRRYHFAKIEYVDLINCDLFSIHEFVRMLDELGLGNGILLFSHFKILGESFDEGLVPLIGDEDVLTLLKHVPKFREIEVYVEVDVSLVKQHMRKVMSGKGKGVGGKECEGKGVVIEEIVEDDGLAEDTNVYTPLVPSSTGENLNLIDSDDDLLIYCSRWSNEGIECDKMKEKVSQYNVIAEEVIGDMNYNLDKIIEKLKLNHDALEMPIGME
ncbi:hypothetical protein Tco_0943363, partial [Tanacetum coccineum]